MKPDVVYKFNRIEQSLFITLNKLLNSPIFDNIGGLKCLIM